MPVEIRALRPEDRAQWEVLWRAYQDFYGVELSQTISDATWSRLLDSSDTISGLGALQGNRLVGIVHTLTHRSTWMVADTCYLQDLYVVPDYRGQGIGRALIEAVYASADAAGLGQVYWLTHVSNAAGRRLYDQLANHAGFIVYERHVEAVAAVTGQDDS